MGMHRVTSSKVSTTRQPLKKWKIEGLALAYKDRPPVTYVIPKLALFALPSLSVVYGAPATLKTLLLQDLAMCVAGNRPWLPSEGTGEDKGWVTTYTPVLWVDLDNGNWRTADRFKALGKSMGIMEDAPLHYVSMPEPLLNAAYDNHISDLTQKVNSYAVKLVIIDNLGVITGNSDENSNQMTIIMEHLRTLSESTGAAVIVIHHKRKARNESSSGPESMRGHTSILASVDTALEIERVKHVDNRPIANITCQKSRDMDIDPFSALFDFKPCPDSTQLFSARFYRTHDGMKPQNAEVAAAILKYIEENPDCNKGDVKRSIKAVMRRCSKTAIESTLTELVTNKQITVRRGNGMNLLYRIVDRSS